MYSICIFNWSPMQYKLGGGRELRGKDLNIQTMVRGSNPTLFLPFSV